MTVHGRYLTILAAIGLILTLGFPAQIASANGPEQLRAYSLPSSRIHSETSLGDLDGDGIDDIVVGSFDGVITAYRGNGTHLWSYDTGDAAIEGKAAIGDIDLDGHNEVIVGIGSTFTPNAAGAVVALSHQGDLLWRYSSLDFNQNGIPDGVHASPALADLDGNDGGRLEIAYGGFDGYVRVLNHDGTLLWERFTRDTIWSSPAIGDIDRDGRPELVIGNDAHNEAAFGTTDGGRLLVLNAEDGSFVPGFPISVDETIWSSPVLADLTGDGWLDIIVGTGNCWTNPLCAVPTGNTHAVTKALYGWDHTGQPLPGWPLMLSDYAIASPSIADIDGDDRPEVLINTADGYVHAFEANGATMPGWPSQVTTPSSPGTVVHMGTTASPITADLTGDGQPEIIIPSNWEIVVFDRYGTQLTRDWFPSSKWDLSTEHTITKTPAVGDVDGDGKLELVSGGARSGGATGAIYLWDFDAADTENSVPWPAFRLNTHNTASEKSTPNLSTSVGLDGLFLMFEENSGEPLTSHIGIASTTSDPIEWQISAPSGISLSDYAGVVVNEEVVVVISISTVSLSGVSANSGVPQYLGDLLISCTVNDIPLPDSPIVVPIHILVVEEIHQTFLPLAIR